MEVRDLRAMTEQLVKELRLDMAIEKEAKSTRNLLPPEIGWDRIVENSPRLQQWIVSQLRAGFTPGGQQVTAVRKTQGARPVPIWGVVERIIYRALTDLVLGDGFKLDRSADAYLAFINAPVRYSERLQRKSRKPQDGQKLFFFMQSDIEYVVKSDIAAFYQYVDHAVLGQELQARGGDFDAISHLLELLREVQGRTYGLPQLFDSSDELSEIYIDRVERQLLRQGLSIWRFNDDFRIACRTYHDALNSIEQLDAAARDAGLVISESKTLTFRFINYMFDSLSLTREPGIDGVPLDDVEAVVGDYTDDFSQDLEAARSLIHKAQVTDVPDDGLDLRKINTDNLRLLRRALGSLTHAADAGVTEDILRLFIYVPALSPTLFRYLSSVYLIAPDRVTDVVDEMISHASMNEWQHQWVLWTIHDLGLLREGALGQLDNRISWVKNKRLESPSAMTAAYATLALSAVRRIEFDQVMRNFEAAPSALLTWYTSALREHYEVGHELELKNRLDAVASMSPLHKALVDDAGS